MIPEAELMLQAKARRRRAEAVPARDEMSLGNVGRQVGLTARAAGPTAAGAVMGAALGAPIGGVGAIPGAGIGALTMTLVDIIDKLGGTNYIEQAMDKMGLPKPEGSTENIAQAAVKAMSGMAAMTGGAQAALKTMAPSPAAKPTLEALAGSPGVGTVAAGAGGAAGELVKEEGGDPTAQFAASVGAAALAPLAVAGGQGIVSGVQSVAKSAGSAIGAAFRHKPSVEAVTADAIKSLVKEDPVAIQAALKDATTYVRGAKPTVAEALAEANLKDPSRQIGGATIKMQDQLTGAKGIEDFLPSVTKAQGAAVARHSERLDKVTGPMRDEAIAAAGQGKLNVLPVTADIILLSARPGYRSNPGILKALKQIEGQLRGVSEPKTGRIHPKDLIDIRGQVGKVIKKKMLEEGSFDKGKSVEAMKGIKGAIDLAMEQAGATGWKRYLQIYSRGKFAEELQAARLVAAEGISKGTSARAIGDIVKEELPRIPTLLHRPTMLVNFALRLIGMEATDPVVRELAKRLVSPKGFLELMARPKGSPAQVKVNDTLIQASILASLIQKHQAEEAPEE